MAVDLGPVSSFTDGKLTRAEVDGREFGVLRWGEENYVFRDVCPHMNARLSRGTCLSRIIDEGLGRLAVDPLAPVVVCPWHRWEFSLSTGGVSLRDDRFSVKMYRAWVEGDHLMADIPLRRRAKELA
jgi:nitrite reductase (NADH) small subunit